MICKILWCIPGALLLLGCSDGLDMPYPTLNWGPASNELFKPEEITPIGNTIIGDWFPCRYSSCSTLEDEGNRFLEDGTWLILNAPGSSLDPSESYCEESASSIKGTYKWDGQFLEISYLGNSFRMAVVLDGDIAYLSVSEAEIIWKRIAPSRSSGPCMYPAPPAYQTGYD